MKNPLKEWDEKGISTFHIKTTLVAGAGTFVDGYDLTAGSLVFPLIEKSLGQGLEGASEILFLSIILGNFLGAIIFGYLAKHGRKKFYGIDAMLMTLGALAQAFVSTPVQLAIVRFLLGLGIGADYVLSPLVNAEYANRKDRGKLMAISGGLMWNVGALGSVFATLAIVNSFPPDTAWRLVLALGAIPALIVIYARRKFPETPRYMLYIKKNPKELEEKYGIKVQDVPATAVSWRRIGVMLLLAALTWYIFDVAAYAGVFFGPNVIAQSIGVNGVIFELIILLAFAIPGNLISTAFNDKVGRKVLQALGFTGMGATTIAFALYGLKSTALVALTLYGLSNIMSQIGPGTVVGFWGIELFPTSIRGITSAVTVMAGRTGVITTTLLVPLILQSQGLEFTMILLGVVSLVGAVATLFLKEPKHRSLDEFEFVESETI
ncbi:MFS transporter [Stygiolobus caldivivus]|uniref:MFS transporter n=1 Tax=Stygiolobus caldivivus TaxID=2824673 RepID=A0A8D5ZH71_9CREN|nr:MFS transporter [Stygiolobus caldivivus]BCU71578.1 MFS transporter [Stygiolobus caldivivus]